MKKLMFLTVAPIQSQSTQGLRRLNPHGTASNELVQWKGRVSFICTVWANCNSSRTKFVACKQDTPSDMYQLFSGYMLHSP